MATYQYTHDNVDLAKLWQETLAAGLPVQSVGGGAIGSAEVYIYTDRDFTPEELLTLDQVVAAHDGRQRVPRPLLAIHADLNNLGTTDRKAVADDLFGPGNKWSENVGPNRGSLFVLWMLTQLGLSAGQIAAAKQGGAAMYVQDNPRYLLHPSFAPAVNIPGDQPKTAP